MLTLVKLYKTHIKGTPEKSVVINLTIHLCNLTNAVKKAGKFNVHRVYITTKVIKHLYDSKPAEEFDFIVHNLPSIVKYPQHIYENKQGKRGELGFVKEINNITYFCSVEKTDELDPKDGNSGMNYIVTTFRLRPAKKDNYLKNYRLLWSWKGDIPSS
ncbi:MAG: hypothetical protein Q8Q91_02760 [Candidatus Daviesbacteria bacterium]|nr:hypothetical protein [Candidatus Daviesbacteria bacterium]